MTRSRRCAPVLLALVAALAVCALVLLPGCSSGEPAADAASDAAATQEDAAGQDAAAPEVDPDDPYATGVHHATIEVEGYGTIEVALNANVAPITVSNFCHLVEQGFYDGLTFHRIIEGFMIQGGRSLGRRHGRLGRDHQGRVLGQRGGEQHPARPRHDLHGALVRL